MRIQNFVGSELKYDVRAIAADPELSQELQMNDPAASRRGIKQPFFN